MIKEIYQISGVGRFKDFTPIPPIKLAKISVFYGENGKGKSSLAAIFLSISDGNLDELDRRTTIGLDKKSIVFSRDGGGKIAYSSPGLKWSQTLEDLLVFDEAFVHENVCIGPLVDIDQRRNLNTVILGSTARQLVEEEQDLKAAIKLRNSQIKATKQDIESQILRQTANSKASLSIEEFITLDPEPQIDSQLVQQKQLADQLRSASNVLSRREFVQVILPEFPMGEIEELLKLSTEDVEASAEARVRTHLVKFTGDGLEDWIERGTGFRSNSGDDCPYCGQSLQSSSLIRHYQAYFGEAYKTLKSDVEEFSGRRLQFESVMDNVNKAITDNVGVSDLWRNEEISGLVYPLQNFEEIRKALDELVACAETLLAEKSGRPLDPRELSADLSDAYKTWLEVRLRISEYNRHHEENNVAIRKHKEGLAAGNLDAVERKLLILENTRIRHTCEVASLCYTYSHLNEEQAKHKRRLKAVQAKIRQQVKQTFDDYGDRVNNYLRRLNADFTLVNLKQRPDGTKRQAEYHIGLLSEKIPVGGDKTADGGQSYKNTLSEGDRRTLALSLFLARLKSTDRVDKKILVFDDPVTSMDDNRSSGTADLILATCERVSQVIVLSHRKRFLRNFWIKYKRSPNRYGELRLLEVCPQESNVDFSDIRPEWDIARATETDFEEHLRYIVGYIRNSPQTDTRNAAPKLRLVLETHYQSLYQDEFADGSTQFGDFVGKVLGCTESSRLYPLKKQDGLELRRLNEATSTFHHPASLDLEETELRQLCKDTLNLIGRRY